MQQGLIYYRSTFARVIPTTGILQLILLYLYHCEESFTASLVTYLEDNRVLYQQSIRL